MQNAELTSLLRKVAAHEITAEEAALQIRTAPFADIGFAKIDTHRGLRQGVPEVIFGAAKTAGQITEICRTMRENGQQQILITRISPEKAGAICAEFPLEYCETGQIGLIGERRKPDGIGRIVVATGGTGDLPAAEEAVFTAEAFGNQVTRLYDVGVAGLHRLLSHLDELLSASVVIAAAGMEGALASVIAGLCGCPVIALPTSVGYGASFGGVAALLSMLNSCAGGVSVVNIDNGFGAAYQAHQINHMGGGNENAIS